MKAELVVIESNSCIKIIQRWYLPRYLVLGFVSLCWNVFFLLEVIRTGSYLAGFFLAVGIIFGYLMCAGILNTTVLELTPTQLSVRHGPLPVAGMLSLHTNQVANFFLETDTSDPEQPAYILKLCCRNGEEIQLLPALSNQRVGFFLRDLLRDFLGQ